MTINKVAVIGAGNWGKNIIRTLDAMGALHSVTDQSAARAGQHQTVMVHRVRGWWQ